MFVLRKQEMLFSAHARGEYSWALAMKSVNCLLRLRCWKKRPVNSLILAREPISASSKIPTGVLANIDSTTATHEPSRCERIAVVFARQNASSTIEFGAL